MRRKVKSKVESHGGGGVESSNKVGDVDWISMPNDIILRFFSFLNHQDRANFSSTCHTIRSLGASPSLWRSLDLRPYMISTSAAVSLSSRCQELQKVSFHGTDSAEAIVAIRARKLREINGVNCSGITDSILSIIGARHPMLETLHLGPDRCDRITSDSIQVVSHCCPKLRKLILWGVPEVDLDAINALVKYCRGLEEVGFMESDLLDDGPLRNMVSLRFLSVAGTINIRWDSFVETVINLPNLIGLDVSWTDVNVAVVSSLLDSSSSLKVLIALNCPFFEAECENQSSFRRNGKLLLTLSTHIYKELASLFSDLTKQSESQSSFFVYWRNLTSRDRKLDRMIDWIEWVLSHFLLGFTKNQPREFSDFWDMQGTSLLLDLLNSSQVDLQERAASAIANFVSLDDQNDTVNCSRLHDALQGNCIIKLLKLTRSPHEKLQAEAAKAIANLSVDPTVAGIVAQNGGIQIFASMASSRNEFVVVEAAGGLWNLSAGDEHKVAIAEAGGIKALINIILKWFSYSKEVLERAAGALANLASNDECWVEVVLAGGVKALVMLARSCVFEGAQEQAARALANLVGHGDSNESFGTAFHGAGAVEVLVQLTYSESEGVRREAAGALWNLALEDGSREAIVAAGGIEALVVLAKSSSEVCYALQERVAGALWGLSVSEPNSAAIGDQGGIVALIKLSYSDMEEVHETAAGALWNLACNARNAFHIVEDGGVSALIRVCFSSVSKIARLMCALTLSFIFDGRMDEFVPVEPPPDHILSNMNINFTRRIALKCVYYYLLSHTNPELFKDGVGSMPTQMLTRIADLAGIQEAGSLKCSESDLRRFISMVKNPDGVLKAAGAFALFQFTQPEGKHTSYHIRIMETLGAQRVLRVAGAATTGATLSRVFAKIALRNLELYQKKTYII